MKEYQRQLREGGVKALLIKLDVKEKQERYEECEEIVQAIREFNQANEKNYPTRLTTDLKKQLQLT
jgi:proteasome assembly chaperone (PAC2) family protein